MRCPHAGATIRLACGPKQRDQARSAARPTAPGRGGGRSQTLVGSMQSEPEHAFAGAQASKRSSMRLSRRVVRHSRGPCGELRMRERSRLRPCSRVDGTGQERRFRQRCRQDRTRITVGRASGRDCGQACASDGWTRQLSDRHEARVSGPGCCRRQGLTVSARPASKHWHCSARGQARRGVRRPGARVAVALLGPRSRRRARSPEDSTRGR